MAAPHPVLLAASFLLHARIRQLARLVGRRPLKVIPTLGLVVSWPRLQTGRTCRRSRPSQGCFRKRNTPLHGKLADEEVPSNSLVYPTEIVQSKLWKPAPSSFFSWAKLA